LFAAYSLRLAAPDDDGRPVSSLLANSRDCTPLQALGGAVSLVRNRAHERFAMRVLRVSAGQQPPSWARSGRWRAQEGGFLEFDFLEKRITLAESAIKVAQGGERSELRSSVVQGWREEDGQQITPIKTWVAFPCRKGKGEFTKVRIVQTGPASAGPGVRFALTNVEFFGALKHDSEA
jgi:hypothetical protein